MNNDMKIPLVLALSFGALSATATETPTLNFPNAKIEMPALSIADSAKQELTSRVFGNAQATPRVESPSKAAAGRRLVSRMPVISPHAETDAAMIIAPNSRVDYKLTVKDPGVESVK